MTCLSKLDKPSISYLGTLNKALSIVLCVFFLSSQSTINDGVKFTMSTKTANDQITPSKPWTLCETTARSWREDQNTSNWSSPEGSKVFQPSHKNLFFPSTFNSRHHYSSLNLKILKILPSYTFTSIETSSEYHRLV